jgi:CRISPR-associated protein Csm3
MDRLLGMVFIRGTLKCRTGLHIGALPETLEACIVDAPIIRHPLTGQPYIPGSALRGKLRWLLERSTTPHLPAFFRQVANVGGRPIRLHTCAEADCPICRLFGAVPLEDGISGSTTGLARPDEAYTPGSPLQVSDLVLDQSAAELYQVTRHGQAAPGRHRRRDEVVEQKAENALDRLTNRANPRDLERVATGTAFRLQCVYRVHDLARLSADLQTLCFALALLEDDTLGGGGSRGAGAVAIQVREIEGRAVGYYETLDDAMREAYRKVRSGPWDLTALIHAWESVIAAFVTLFSGGA